MGHRQIWDDICYPQSTVEKSSRPSVDAFGRSNKLRCICLFAPNLLPCSNDERVCSGSAVARSVSRSMVCSSLLHTLVYMEILNRQYRIRLRYKQPRRPGRRASSWMHGEKETVPAGEANNAVDSCRNSQPMPRCMGCTFSFYEMHHPCHPSPNPG